MINDKGAVTAIVRHFAASPSPTRGHAKHLAYGGEVEGDKEDSGSDHEVPESLKAATEDIMVALGQDYGSGTNAEKGQRQAFEDKRDRLADALCRFLDLYDKD